MFFVNLSHWLPLLRVEEDHDHDLSGHPRRDRGYHYRRILWPVNPSIQVLQFCMHVQQVFPPRYLNQHCFEALAKLYFNESVFLFALLQNILKQVLQSIRQFA